MRRQKERLGNISLPIWRSEGVEGDGGAKEGTGSIALLCF